MDYTGNDVLLLKQGNTEIEDYLSKSENDASEQESEIKFTYGKKRVQKILRENINFKRYKDEGTSEDDRDANIQEMKDYM